MKRVRQADRQSDDYGERYLKLSLEGPLNLDPEPNVYTDFGWN